MLRYNRWVTQKIKKQGSKYGIIEIDQKTINHKGEPCKDMLSQMKHFRQRIIKYLGKHTVTEASIHFKINRKTIYNRGATTKDRKLGE